ncbi:hypothetical protein BEP19_07415 [Ammoniphilus oxalaticus]|uniref:Uncharacterized protein n=1 Tax=Ammoniphilus oxalaticus TaxID=66863 RepID=A0A419SJS3_9BACL|nr:hypothetical protein [Ammoniphilus oxalaticus]RKD24225.1 hypothetical protein BEP19_07415 [Ammoniphilus oxalaticus]
MKNKIEYIINHYPTNSTDYVARKLNLTPSKVRSIAKGLDLKKCEDYKKSLMNRLVEDRRKWYEANIPPFSPTHLQEQIILGSLLGDGYISKGRKEVLTIIIKNILGKVKEITDSGNNLN